MSSKIIIPEDKRVGEEMDRILKKQRLFIFIIVIYFGVMIIYEHGCKQSSA